MLDVGWFLLLLGFFVWAPRILLHNRVAARDILPGAVFTMLGLVGMRIISGVLLKHWLEWYSKTYGALGIVMAMIFWIIVAATILVLAAALSPALAHRRDLRRGGLSGDRSDGRAVSPGRQRLSAASRTVEAARRSAGANKHTTLQLRRLADRASLVLDLVVPGPHTQHTIMQVRIHPILL